MTSVHALPGLASRIFYVSPGGGCIRFYFAVVVDHSPSLRAGCVKPLNCRPYQVLVGLRQFLLNQIPDIELYLSLSLSGWTRN